MRLVFLSVSGAFLLSLALSMIGSPSLFGGGLGGDAGAAVVAALVNIMGPIIPIFLIIALAVVWMLFASGRFAHWFAEAGMKPSAPTPEPAGEEAEEPELPWEPEISEQTDDVEEPDEMQVDYVHVERRARDVVDHLAVADPEALERQEQKDRQRDGQRYRQANLRIVD